MQTIKFTDSNESNKIESDQQKKDVELTTQTSHKDEATTDTIPDYSLAKAPSLSHPKNLSGNL